MYHYDPGANEQAHRLGELLGTDDVFVEVWVKPCCSGQAAHVNWLPQYLGTPVGAESSEWTSQLAKACRCNGLTQTPKTSSVQQLTEANAPCRSPGR